MVQNISAWRKKRDKYRAMSWAELDSPEVMTELFKTVEGRAIVLDLLWFSGFRIRWEMYRPDGNFMDDYRAVDAFLQCNKETMLFGLSPLAVGSAVVIFFLGVVLVAFCIGKAIGQLFTSIFF